VSANGGAGRWWENYLVRYFMPSIAGTAIVAFLLAAVNPWLRHALFFGGDPHSLDTPTLTLLILYGNLFCYVASYPILSFHVTRVVDFENYTWKPGLSRRGLISAIADGYVATALVGLLVLLVARFVPGMWRVFFLLLFASGFSFCQFLRFGAALSSTGPVFEYPERSTSLLYAYLIDLAKKRAITYSSMAAPSSTVEPDDEPAATMGTDGKEGGWREEFTDSYRHMREHGNFAFIFLLELILASACYGIITAWPKDAKTSLYPTMSLPWLVVLLAVWSAPAAAVHLLGQHVEHRFSRFDDRRKHS
jgi:hypothetical protein